MRPLLVLVVLAGLAAAAPVPKALKRTTDTKQLIGAWRPTTSTSSWFEFSDDGSAVSRKSRDRGLVTKWAFSAADEIEGVGRLFMSRVGSNQVGYECAFERDGDTLKLLLIHTPGMPPGPPAGWKSGTHFELHELALEK